MSWWNTEPHSGEYGGRTVAGPAWPNVDEFVLSLAARSLEQFRDDLRSTVIVELSRQMMALSDVWEGSGSESARDETSAIIDEHEADANAEAAEAESSAILTVGSKLSGNVEVGA